MSAVQSDSPDAVKSVFSVLSANLRTYRVVSPLFHDNERYPIGSSIDLSAEQAEPLLGHTIVPMD